MWQSESYSCFLSIPTSARVNVNFRTPLTNLVKSVIFRQFGSIAGFVLSFMQAQKCTPRIPEFWPKFTFLLKHQIEFVLNFIRHLIYETLTSDFLKSILLSSTELSLHGFRILLFVVCVASVLFCLKNRLVSFGQCPIRTSVNFRMCHVIRLIEANFCHRGTLLHQESV